MSLEKNKQIVRRYIEEVINTGDVEDIEQIVSSEYTEVLDGTRHPVGIEGAKQHILGVRQTYPDLHLTIDRQIAEGEWVATCITARGTHEGVWLGISQRGRRLRIPASISTELWMEKSWNTGVQPISSGRCWRSARLS